MVTILLSTCIMISIFAAVGYIISRLLMASVMALYRAAYTLQKSKYHAAEVRGMQALKQLGVHVEKVR